MADEISGDSEDYFDLLPDPIVLIIFNKLADIKALGRCSAVSMRFNELVPKVENVSVKVDHLISTDGRARRALNSLKKLILASIMKPFKFLHLFGSRKAMPSEVPDHSPGDILKNFKELQHLRIELPVGELFFGQDVLLKWKAEFGSTLERCVILGASSLVKGKRQNKKILALKSRLRITKHSGEQTLESPGLDDVNHLPEQDERSGNTLDLYTNECFKVRVMWTISSLIAASARHHLLQQIIFDHPTLESLVLTDAAGQGTLCMNKEQLQNFRDNPSEASASLNRTQVPALNMRLWYAPSLKLLEGTALKGATLVAIEPSDGTPRQAGDDFVAGAFEEPFSTATSRLAKCHTYLLEMNSF